LLLALIDAAAPIHRIFDWTQKRAERRLLTIENARHVPAERAGHEDHDRAEQRDLKPSLESRRKLLRSALRRSARNSWPYFVHPTDLDQPGSLVSSGEKLRPYEEDKQCRPQHWSDHHHQCGAGPVESGQARLACKIDFMRLLDGSSR
jgi:hypothetical protein